MRTILLLVLLIVGAPRSSGQQIDGRALFLEAWGLVQENFYDAGMNGIDWEAVRDDLLPAAQASADGPAASEVINRALARLGASHTAHYGPCQREYYELMDVFHPQGLQHRVPALPAGRVSYVGIGLVARRIDGEFFAADVYDGGPAASAGVLVGDRLAGVEDGPWGDIEPFRGRAGVETRLLVQRSAEAPVREIVVTPATIRPRQMFLRAMEEGARVFGRDGASLAYVRVRSYAHGSYHDLLKELLGGRLRRCKGLVLDLRAGWGGASPEYMDIFNPAVPRMEMQERAGRWVGRSSVWDRPVVVLIDGGTRSGKEMLAHAFAHRTTATLVGTRTAGAVLGGMSQVLSDGSLLIIAATDVRVDGVRLEGVGVAPDIEVEWDIRYAEGNDPQLERALEVLAEKVKAGRVH